MQRATSVIRKPAVKAEKVIDIVVLDHEGRHRRRVTLAGQGGTSFLLDLDKATVLNDGDALKLDDGTLIAVKAADQSLIEITAATPKRLMRIAWHIGNRHTPAEIGEEAVWIEPDHVLVEMVRGLGAEARPVVRPFQPERGAYEAAEAHGHGHAHDHGHDHDAMTTRPTDTPATTIRPTDSPAMFMARVADTTMPTTMGTHTTRAMSTAPRPQAWLKTARCRCSSGCRPPSRLAHSRIRTASNGLSKSGEVTMQQVRRRGSTTCCAKDPAGTTLSSWPPRTAP